VRTLNTTQGLSKTIDVLLTAFDDDTSIQLLFSPPKSAIRIDLFEFAVIGKEFPKSLSFRGRILLWWFVVVDLLWLLTLATLGQMAMSRGWRIDCVRAPNNDSIAINFYCPENQ